MIFFCEATTSFSYLTLSPSHHQKFYVFLDKGSASSGLYIQGIHSQLLQSFNTRTIEQNQSQTRENETKPNDNCASTLIALVPELLSQSLCSARRVCSWPTHYASIAPRNITNIFPCIIELNLILLKLIPFRLRQIVQQTAATPTQINCLILIC